MERARLEELIQAQLDGELSAADRAGLARFLLQDSGARRLHDDFVRTDRLLRDIPGEPPPPGLREAILAGLAGRGRPQAPRDARRSWGWQRIAAAFAGGLLVVGLAYVVGDGLPPGGSLQGSLDAGRGPEVPAAAAGASRASVQSEGITLDAVLRRDRGALRLELGSASDEPIEVAVRFDPATTAFAGGTAGAAPAPGGGEVLVRMDAGAQRATLDFSGNAPFEVELRAGGRVLGTARIELSAP